MQVRRADVDDIDQLADLLGEVFHDAAPARWLVVNPVQRALVLPAYARIHVEDAVRFGEVHFTTDQSAVGVWFPHDRPRPEPTSHHTRLALACGQFADRFHALETALSAHHPHASHHHLALLAVRAERQRHGLGSALLRWHHAYLDTHDIPGYVQVCSRRGRDFYQRHGYGVCGEPLKLPDSTSVWPMWRDPNPTT